MAKRLPYTGPVPSVRNVTRVFRAATPDQLAKGVEWYARAQRLAVELAAQDLSDPDGILPAHRSAERWQGDVDRAAAVIAVLSPQETWTRNVELAREVYRRARGAYLQSQISDGLGTLGASARKAARLLLTDEPTDEIVGGPKVTAFWHTIADPLDPFAVVVDRHAFDVSVARVTDDETRQRGLSGRRYEQACDVYRRAAVILSREYGPTSPATVQAVTWTVWRETKIRTKFAAQREA